MNIGIVGFGFVGKAIYHGLFRKFQRAIDIHIYDPFVNWEEITDWRDKVLQGVRAPILTETLIEISHCEYIFICVPTPTNFKTGKQDTSIVEDIIEGLVSCKIKGSSIIVIKSTVKPGTTQELITKYPHTQILFNPEFLTEKNYLTDFFEQDRIVIGGDIKPAYKLRDFYRLGWPEADDYVMSATEAELVKYTNNAFLSTKISFFNEIYQLALALGLDYGKIRRAVADDERIGGSHTFVPGKDGQFGFGGKCFPKDLLVLLNKYEEVVGTNPEVMTGTWHTNLSVRENQDWEDIKGATTENLHG